MKAMIYGTSLLALMACSNGTVIIDDTPAVEIKVGDSIDLHTKAGANYTEPNAPAWRDVQEYRIDLSLAPPVHPSVNLRYQASAPTVPISIRTASDGARFYIRLRWQDSSQNITTSRSDFADAVAVQFALNGATSTPYLMGSPSAPVNIWYWKAGTEEAENLAAGGFGSTSRLPLTDLSVSSEYRRDGEWVVVFSRPIDVDGKHQMPLTNDKPAAISLAVWQGAEQQRDGLKHVTQGWLLVDEPNA